LSKIQDQVEKTKWLPPS